MFSHQFLLFFACFGMVSAKPKISRTDKCPGTIGERAATQFNVPDWAMNNPVSHLAIGGGAYDYVKAAADSYGNKDTINVCIAGDTPVFIKYERQQTLADTESMTAKLEVTEESLDGSMDYNKLTNKMASSFIQYGFEQCQPGNCCSYDTSSGSGSCFLSVFGPTVWSSGKSVACGSNWRTTNSLGLQKTDDDKPWCIGNEEVSKDTKHVSAGPYKGLQAKSALPSGTIAYSRAGIALPISLMLAISTFLVSALVMKLRRSPRTQGFSVATSSGDLLTMPEA